MRGQNALSRLRLSGYKPRYVWLFALSEPCRRETFRDAENTLSWSQMPEVHVGFDEPLAALDFRPLVGATVLLQGADRARLRAIFQRLKAFDPIRVIVSDGELFHDTGAA